MRYELRIWRHCAWCCMDRGMSQSMSAMILESCARASRRRSHLSEQELQMHCRSVQLLMRKLLGGCLTRSQRFTLSFFDLSGLSRAYLRPLTSTTWLPGCLPCSISRTTTVRGTLFRLPISYVSLRPFGPSLFPIIRPTTHPSEVRLTHAKDANSGCLRGNRKHNQYA